MEGNIVRAEATNAITSIRLLSVSLVARLDTPMASLG
jgi:hypothetical protein